MMKSALFAAVLTVAGLGTTAALAQELTPINKLPAGVYTLDKTHASLTWKVSHAGMSNYTARFKSFDAEVTLDPADLTKSKVTAKIDPTSLETDYVPTTEKDFNKNLVTKEEWFNAGKFPEITFTSTKIETTGDTTGKIHGDLTLLGVTKPVVLDAVFNGGYAEGPFTKKPAMGFSATTSITRSDFGFSTYVPMIGDKVDIIIEAEFGKKD
ncbi:MAG: YceI family protein [Bdellovibrionales bacterium]|jgi:polyisoprenoid-binding protein YceI|nr:YceI family protein [Bdellovibrionales bacterium]